ncbi:hypothetical protein STCU_08959 [Strigomonas culicis]|nr:hypothetical protein STCU_08959 [Strigomonas culicis]|eukprot:EPY20517.1 hypothetical protein STCU_08959 [Strigomonas culicis]
MSCKTEGEFDELRELLDTVVLSEQAYASSLPEGFAEEAAGAGVEQPPVSRAALAQIAQSVIAEKEASWRGYRASYTTERPNTVDEAVRAQFPHLLFGLRGFCPVTYATSGLLVEGKLHTAEDPTSPGFIVVEGGTGAYALPKPWAFAFSQESSLRAFVADPPRYFLPCLQERNRTEPAVALLLGLEDYLPGELYVAGARRIESTSLSRVAGVKTDAATQTGQRDPYFDRNYRWNEWDLRREALKLVNLMNMRTHSSQTAASNFRRENATQADPPKEVSTQTMQDAATQPPRVVQYLKGMRGTESSEIKQVKTTISY